MFASIPLCGNFLVFKISEFWGEWRTNVDHIQLAPLDVWLSGSSGSCEHVSSSCQYETEPQGWMWLIMLQVTNCIRREISSDVRNGRVNDCLRIGAVSADRRSLTNFAVHDTLNCKMSISRSCTSSAEWKTIQIHFTGHFSISGLSVTWRPGGGAVVNTPVYSIRVHHHRDFTLSLLNS